MKHFPPAIFLMGPTASGKTGLAIELVKRFPVELISVDSALVYRDMTIGTAKPTAEELAQAPHRLISFLDPAKAYSAADFRRDALAEMVEITEAGKVPLLVGGTSLYFRALEQGLAKLPAADLKIRRELEQEAGLHGWEFMHRRLADVDPVSAEKIHPNDPQRIQRALEVYRLTGIPLSYHHRNAASDALPYRLLKLALVPDDREWLRKRIALRFEQMLAQGFVAEVESLYARGDLHRDLPAIRAVGYRQVWEYLEGRLDREEMRERGIIATRQLAKRQLTWLRSEENVIRLPAEQVSSNKVSQLIERFLEQVE